MVAAWGEWQWGNRLQTFGKIHGVRIHSLFLLWMVSQEDAYVKNLSNCVKNLQFMIHQLHFDKTLKNKKL